LKNFKFPDYHPLRPQQTNQALKTLLSGAEAWQAPGGQVRINGLRIETFREDGGRELEVSASECLLDIASRQASGPGRLQVVTANGLYSIEGEGFQWQQSNAVLIISNRVVTRLQRGVVASRSLALDAITNTAASTSLSATSDVIRVSSDTCLFESQSNRVVQRGHVVVEDPQMELTCETLQAQFTPERRLRGLAAEGGVSLLNQADGSRATAGRAVYEVAQNQEIISLLDQPVWRDRDGRQEARAERFTFDRVSRQIRGEGGATLRLPRGNFSQPSLAFGPTPPRPAAGARLSDTNQIQISSETLTLLLPATNRPYRSAVADTRVVILSPADDTRATGDRAVYREDTGLIDLVGNARWEAEGRLVSADTLTMDRTNKVFLGRGNAFFRQPLNQAGRGLSFRVSTNRVAATNLVLEIQSDQLTYRTNALVFEGTPVRARLLEGRTLRGVATCGLLTAYFSNRLERVVAEQRVVAENYPPPGPKAKAVTNLLSCETLTGAFSEDGQRITIVAATNVQAAQIETRPPPKRTTVTDLTCDLLTVHLLPKAGKVDRILAEKHVVISQEDKRARGGRALYSGRQNQVELSDHPYAEFKEGRVTDAETLIWDRGTGVFKGRGRYRIEWTGLPGQTNTLEWPPLMKK
jgi:lipopolysaccharide export system protein LptA